MAEIIVWWAQNVLSMIELAARAAFWIALIVLALRFDRRLAEALFRYGVSDKNPEEKRRPSLAAKFRARHALREEAILEERREELRRAHNADDPESRAEEFWTQ